MKLLDTLVEHLKDWPEQISHLWCGQGNSIYGKAGPFEFTFTGGWDLPDDHVSATVTRAEWQAAVEALKAEQAAELKWPDGATHYVPPQEKNENGVFYLVVNDEAVYAWALLKSGIDNGGRVYGEGKRHQLPAAILRPTERAVEWDGVSRPTEGQRLEVSYAVEGFSEWHKATCVTTGKDPEGRDLIIAKSDSGVVSAFRTLEFVRKIRTQEQIKAEEREKAIEEMILLDEKGSLSRTHFCGLLYDAGYGRKQVAK